MSTKVMKIVEDAAVITGLVAGIGWVGKKALKEDLTGNPASNIMNYVKMTAVIAGSLAIKDYLEAKKLIPTV
jgi:hypothetical protein